MKKRWLVLLFTLVGLLVCAFGLVACGGSSGGGTSVRGTYYAYENGELNKEDYITLSTGGKCEISALSLDFEGAKITSTYKTSGSSITITVTVDMFGEKESETITGTVSGGVLELDMLGTYYQEGKEPGNGDNPPAEDEVRITLNANGGTFASGNNTVTVNVKKGQTIRLDSVPTRTGGYVLSGWATDRNGNNLFDIANETITGEVTTLYAVWARQITVTLNANGGVFENGNETYETIVANGALLTIGQTPLRDGYQFTGWYTDRAAGENSAWDLENDTVTRTTTLYAGWKPEIDDYQVTYYPNYDGAEPVVMSTENGKATYVPERTGYVFNGWWYDSDPEYSTKFDPTKLVTENITLYADWILESEAAKVLSSPVSVAVKDGYITWSAVTGASSYRVIVTHVSDYETVTDYDGTVTGTSVYFPGNSAGSYNIRVRANGNGETTVNSSYTVYTYAYLVLSQTTIDFDITNSVLTWTAVPNARYYELIIDSETISEYLSYTYYDMSEYEAGTHSVRIIAKNDSYGYITSSASATVNKRRLKTPAVTVDANSANRGYILTWDEVAHADRYVLTFGTQTVTVDKLSDDAFWTPYYSIGQNSSYWNDQSLTFSVKAYDSNNDYLVSAATEDRELTKLYGLNAYTPFPDSTQVLVYGNYYGGAGRATVSFDLNGASGYISSQTVTGSSPLSYPSVPTRSGYVFGGWYTNSACTGTPYDFSAEITSSDCTLYAKWVSYEGSGILNYNDSASLYLSSSNSSNNSGYYAFVPLVSGQITISASSSFDSDAYLYDSNKSELTKSTSSGDFTINYQVTAGELYYLRPYGYQSSGNATITISGPEPADGGLPTNGWLVPYGEEITLSTERSYSNYIFEGWYQVVNGTATKIESDPDSPYSLTYTVGAENVEYYANWIPNPVTVEAKRYNVGDSSELSGDYSGSLSNAYKVGDTVTLTAREYNGYTFLGWYLGDDVSNLVTNSLGLEITVTTQEIKFLAAWATCPVVLETTVEKADVDTTGLAGGTVSGVESGTLLNADTTVTAVNNEGYTFVGWYDSDGNKVSSGNSLTYTFQITLSDVENYIANGTTVNYTAKWTYYTVMSIQSIGDEEIRWIDIEYNLNYGSAPVYSQRVVSHNKLAYPEIPLRDNYVFAGWYADASCSGNPFDFFTEVTADTTLYAKWIAHSGAGVIAYNGNSGSISCVSRNSSSGQKDYAFVPLVTGSITIYSTNNSGDTYGYLYSASKTQLATDDDSGSNQNFSITYNVTAGTLYYVRPCGYSSTQTMTVHVTGAQPAEDVLSSYVKVTVGEPHTVFAEEKDGYTFLGWYKLEDDTLISTEAVYDYTMTAEDVILVAKYAQA